MLFSVTDVESSSTDQLSSLHHSDNMAGAMAVQTLSEGWSFKQTDTNDWLSVARVPTNVHLDLLDHKK
jgi:hypothetical protein